MAHYSNDFKRDALRYIQEHPEMKIKDIADYLGVPAGTLYDWNKKMHRSYILGEDAPRNLLALNVKTVTSKMHSKS